ncbi:ribonuclease D [Acinetobacter lwoffii]|uniref:Cro/CI family transcriptional regulator n=1 Tax=Acinetobacter lwoffii TaxID=28090 RepID=UPI000A32A68F|nr:ribonuclease D [Acinetobacter lwoffii]
MTRDEAIQLLDCSLSELADRLGITTAAVAKWNKQQIPRLREYEIRALAEGRTPYGLPSVKTNLPKVSNSIND